MTKLKNNWVYIKLFRKNSIFWRTFLLILLLIFVPFITLSVIFYSNSIKSIHEEITVENVSLLESSANIIDNTLSECDMMSSSISGNESAQLFMINGKTTDSFSTLLRFAQTLPIIYKYIDSVYIYSEPAAEIIAASGATPLSEFPDKSWLENYKYTNSAKGTMFPRIKNNTYPPLITIIKPIYAVDEKRGAVIMNINAQTLYTSLLYERYKNRQSFFLVNNNNSIIMSNDTNHFNLTPEDIGFCIDDICSASAKSSYNINDENYTLLLSNSQFSDYHYVSAYPLSSYEQKLSMFKLQIMFILIFLLIVVFILAYIASAKSYAPLREIIAYLNDLSTPLNDKANNNANELMYIINSIRLHIEDKTKTEKILEERVKLLRKAQYDMLQTQINPHFLYNTLETINWMAYDLSKSENPVSKSLITLASFFRNTLSAGYLISIEEEIKNTKEYVNILALRYGDLFDINWDIEDDILSYTIIKICLQPIIENSVYHGLKPKLDKGLINVLGKKEDNNIFITVSDNGIGMSEDSLKELNDSLANTSLSDEKSHIGLTNVNKRIKIIFGDNYGLSVTSVLGKGTSVRITIPCENQTIK